MTALGEDCYYNFIAYRITVIHGNVVQGRWFDAACHKMQTLWLLEELVRLQKAVESVVRS